MEAYKAKVWADNSYPVKMRKSPSANSTILMQIPQGGIVEVTGKVNETWSAIEYNGRPGYMMSKFLVPSDENETASDYDKLEELCELLAKANEILYNLMHKEGDANAD